MLPHYYSSLSPFRETFRRGLPILTYHKLGPRPTNARLKGLYLSRRLFERQMAELKNADFQATRLSDAAKPVSGATGRIVITFDDGFRNVLEHGLDTLARFGFLEAVGPGIRNYSEFRDRLLSDQFMAHLHSLASARSGVQRNLPNPTKRSAPSPSHSISPFAVTSSRVACEIGHSYNSYRGFSLALRGILKSALDRQAQEISG